MSEPAPQPERKTLIRRFTQMFSRGSSEPEKGAAIELKASTESDEKREERLAAYRKLCEEEARNQSAEEGVKKKIKYRAADMNSGQHTKVD